MSKSDQRSAAARGRAEAVWSRAKESANQIRDEEQAAERAKIARLRALRLAKEATDRVAAEAEAERKAAIKTTRATKRAAAPKATAAPKPIAAPKPTAAAKRTAAAKA